MKKKILNRLLSLMALTLIATGTHAQNTINTPQAASPAAEVSQTIGISKITINYSRPAVNGREGRIWGQIVPFGYTVQGFGNGKKIPWRAGANENTVITFTEDVKVEDKELKAGSYGLHVAYFENGEADVIFSNNTSSWGSFWYEESEDALRVRVKSVENDFTERLTYDFVDINANSAVAVLDWENKRIPFKVEYAVHDIVVQNAMDMLRGSTGFGFQGPLSAAQYCVNNNTHLDQALIWADQALNMVRNAQTLNVKGQVLFALKRDAEGLTVMNEMVDDPSVLPNNVYAFGNQLISLNKDKEALEVFKKMYKKWGTHALAQHGMARAYSANGDFKKAVKYEKECLENPTLPANNKPVVAGLLKRLESGEDITAPAGG
jgi:tetratricopeptide (TPR) repeat protein